MANISTIADRSERTARRSVRSSRTANSPSYFRRPDDTEFRAFTLDDLRLRGSEIAEITTFDPHPFPAFGLPEILSAQ